MNDAFGRPINYLRIALTDKCNLRCQYCIPNDTIKFLKKNQLLSYEEWFRLITIFESLGVNKIRISGGEPLLRKDAGNFLKHLKHESSIKNLGITTNGTMVLNHLDHLDGYSINLSLDSIDPKKFNMLTQRNDAEAVFLALYKLLKLNKLNKINAVIMKGKNHESLLEMPYLIKDHDIQLRFIEAMPFNGGQTPFKGVFIPANQMVETVKSKYPSLELIPSPKNATALSYKIDGFKGTLGFIPAYSRTICGGCNRIRVTSDGILKTCLYDNGVLNLKDLIRNGSSDIKIKDAILSKVDKKPKDGFMAEKMRENNPFQSMTKIGG